MKVRSILQDIHGMSLLGYVAGINAVRSSKLLDVLINSSPRSSVALLTCARRDGVASALEDGCARKDGVSIFQHVLMEPARLVNCRRVL